MYCVAIVGRPNVGKSTLFNKLTRSRKAIVGDEPGITRDRLFETAEWEGKHFEVIDTGGMLPQEKEVLPEQILRQAEVAMEEADLILLVVDGRQGVTPVDESLNSLLRSAGKEFLLVVNKIDAPSLESHVLPFYALGADQVLAISAEHSEGLDPLLEKILERVPETPPQEVEDEIRVAIIGRPNMGKSSILNRLMGQDRVIVTDIPGTTRDAVDSLLVDRGRRFRLIDTAGIRRKGKTKLMADKLSVVMARKNIERADVVLLIIEPLEGATKLDATIAGYAHDAGKSLIVVVNKWDLIEKDPHTAQKLEREFRMRMRFLDYAPFVFVSAKTGQRVFKLLEFVGRAYQARYQRVPTGELNRFFESEVQMRVPALQPARKAPILYASQVGVAPPRFVLFTRTRRKLHFSTQRFVINQLRKRFTFYATPVQIVQRVRRASGRNK